MGARESAVPVVDSNCTSSSSSSASSGSRLGSDLRASRRRRRRRRSRLARQSSAPVSSVAVSPVVDVDSSRPSGRLSASVRPIRAVGRQMPERSQLVCVRATRPTAADLAGSSERRALRTAANLGPARAVRANELVRADSFGCCRRRHGASVAEQRQT